MRISVRICLTYPSHRTPLIVTLRGVVKLLFFIGAAFKRAYFAFKYLCYLSEWAIQHLLVSYKDHRTDTEKTPPKAGEFCSGQVARDSFGLL